MKRTTRILAAIVIATLSLSACTPAAPQQVNSVADAAKVEQTRETITKKESENGDEENPIAPAAIATETTSEPIESTPYEPIKTEKILPRASTRRQLDRN